MSRRAFICVVPTMCSGLVASWRGDDEKPVLYNTQQEAEVDANDPEMLAMGNEPDGVLEVVVEDHRIYDPVDNRIYWQRASSCNAC